MGKDWEKWSKFRHKYSHKIIYGTDFYPFPKGEKWQGNFTRRLFFLRNFLQTDGEHSYVDGNFKGVLISEELRETIYRKNFTALLKEPKKVSAEYVKQTAKKHFKLQKRRTLRTFKRRSNVRFR